MSNLLDTAWVALSYVGYLGWAAVLALIVIGHGIKLTKPFADRLTKKNK